MKQYYLIKSLKWTRQNGHVTWYAPNCNGYADKICDAGIYTEEDMKGKEDGIKQGVIEFVPLTEEIIRTGKVQVNREISKLSSWLQQETDRLKKVEEIEKLIKGEHYER